MSLREDFNRDGYVVLRGEFFPPYKSSWTDKHFRKAFGNGVSHYVGYLTSVAKSVYLKRLFFHPALTSNIEKLGLENPIVSSEPVVHVLSPNLRIKNGYNGTDAHQDWPSVQGSLDSVTVWIALTDCGKGRYPLEIIPMSHRNGLMKGYAKGSVLRIKTINKKFIPIYCKAGDVIIMSGFLIHRTGKGNKFRAAISQRFDNATEPTFIERGYPCAQKRIVDREIKWKPTVEQVRAIYALD